MKEPVLVELDEFFVMGIEVTTSEALEAGLGTARIPLLWRTFFAEKVEEKIANRRDPNEHVGVCTDYNRDPKSREYGSYAALAGCEVTEVGDDVPEGLVAMSVPAGSYLLFEARGPMPDAVMRTWDEIKRYFETGSPYERAFTADFDLYRNDQPEAVDIFVSVK
ncbi:MAG TPA: GyrI-like domain-containing protein [bacterium]|nr:GyrI-like domain-containing protein [bacterium]